MKTAKCRYNERALLALSTTTKKLFKNDSRVGASWKRKTYLGVETGGARAVASRVGRRMRKPRIGGRRRFVVVITFAITLSCPSNVIRLVEFGKKAQLRGTSYDYQKISFLIRHSHDHRVT